MRESRAFVCKFLHYWVERNLIDCFTFIMVENVVKLISETSSTQLVRQRGPLGFSIYDHDIQKANDDTNTDNVAKKIQHFACSAVAVGWMKNKAYSKIGTVTMGIAGSSCDAGVLQKHFGICIEWVGEVEILRECQG